MRRRPQLAWACLLGALAAGAFGACARQAAPDLGAEASSTGGGVGGGGSSATATTTSATGAGGDDIDIDSGLGDDGGLSPDAACASATIVAPTTQLPVDIIWMVDNSASMASAILEVQAGLDDFAALIETKNLDYHVVMLSLRSATSPVTIGGSKRYPVCIPQPLAGDDACGNGPRFFQSSIDIRSTQPLEQFLGTLGQTAGYQPGDAKGGEPWAQFLRPDATKTIVVATDDNARLSVSDFETFAGGQNPFNTLTLPPGILDPSWGGMFDGYLFSGVYGWGSDVDPSVKCTFPDQTQPASSGPTYTALVNKTGGVRAKLCDGAQAWASFFDAVAAAVIATSKLSCELAIPPPPEGETLDYGKINVFMTGGPSDLLLPKVADAASCAPDGGWYYDAGWPPQTIYLCPESCDQANNLVGPDKPGGLEVQLGCETVVK